MPTPKTQCPACGGEKDARAAMCRKCKDHVGETRPCTKCGLEKKVSEFRIRTRVNPKPRSQCKACEAQEAKDRREAKPMSERKIATRRWEKNNPDKHRASVLRKSIRMLGLGHMVDTLVARVQAEQVCECCGATVGRLRIDHDHETGAFRGLLCNGCNCGIGHFYDDPERLRKAIAYLDRHNHTGE
jgi:hypothetical protein